MIQRAITAIIGVVIGLFATFAVFSAILGGLDSFYLLTQDACNYGSLNSPKRVLRVAPENPEHPGDADEIDWSRDGLDVVQAGDGCAVPDAISVGTHLTPTGDEFTAAARTSASLTATTFDLPGRYTDSGIWVDGDDIWYVNSGLDVNVYSRSSGSVSTTRTFELDAAQAAPISLFGHGQYLYVLDQWVDKIFVYERSTGNRVSSRDVTLTGNNDSGFDLWVTDTHVYVTDVFPYPTYAYRLSDGGYDSGSNLAPFGNLDHIDSVYIHDGQTYYHIRNEFSGYSYIEIAPSSLSLSDARNEGLTLVRPLDGKHFWIALNIVDGRFAYFGGIDRSVRVYDLGAPAGDYTWVPAENVFTAQERLVTLLAVIAAIGMPIGAMTAIVFFGQAVISSGISGSGASQVMVAIAAVVVILVSIQMFQQFAGFLGNAFDAVNGDRFVVFDETLGSLAETIAEFWGVLAFAGFINIASIVWRNYSGNFSIGGTQGGL